MFNILNFLIKTFYNTLYRFRPPEAVGYWKRGDSARAKVIHDKDGVLKMEIEGEKFLYNGFPRGHVLTGPLAILKNRVKNMVFNQAFAEIEKMAEEQKMNMLPPEKMVVAVRHIWETFEKLEDMEVVPDMKGRIKLIKTVLCYLLQEDDAYRARMQAFLWLIDQKKIKFSKEDKYYNRGKYFKQDRYLKLFGKVFDKYEY